MKIRLQHPDLLSRAIGATLLWSNPTGAPSSFWRSTEDAGRALVGAVRDRAGVWVRGGFFHAPFAAAHACDAKATRTFGEKKATTKAMAVLGVPPRDPVPV